MKRKGLPLSGWLALDKPLGMTSTQALAKARWLLNAAKAGHGGTLDPLASGILPLAFGEATKTVAYVMDATKRYRFTLKFGEATSSEDAEGEVIARSDVRPTPAALTAVLPRFIGEIQQMPPRFSALKVDGARAYDLARAGEEFELRPRQVRIDSLNLISLIPAQAGIHPAGGAYVDMDSGFRRNEADRVEEAVLEVTCGKGTYVRSLARDLAQALDTVGYITELRRLQVGRFCEQDAISLDELAAKVQNTPADQLLLPIETALGDIPALAITAQEAQRLRMGQAVSLLHMSDRERLMALPEGVRRGESPLVALLEGKAVALGEMAAGELRVVRGFTQ